MCVREAEVLTPCPIPDMTAGPARARLGWLCRLADADLCRLLRAIGQDPDEWVETPREENERERETD